MRRVQAILVIIALMSAPLGLLAVPTSAQMAGCDGMCCLPHHGQHPAGSHHPVSQAHQHQGESCEHGGTGKMPNCAMNCGHAATDYSFLSPVAPTKPSKLVSIWRFDLPKISKVQYPAQNAAAGFLSTPFQPPRA